MGKTKEQIQELEELLGELNESFNTFKATLRYMDPHVYSRWHAGGERVSGDFVSMYPCAEDAVEEVIQRLQSQLNYEPEDESECDN